MHFTIPDIFLDMLPHMLLEVAFLGEGLVTNGAHKGPDALMHAEVVQEVPGLYEFLLTVIKFAYYDPACPCSSTNRVIS